MSDDDRVRVELGGKIFVLSKEVSLDLRAFAAATGRDVKEIIEAAVREGLRKNPRGRGSL